MEYVRNFNKDELLKVAAALLKASVNNKIGSDFDKDLTIRDDRNRNNNRSRNTSSKDTRVFLTIGKLDNLKKGTLLDFMKKETGIDKDCFNNIEILTKFTFLDVTTTEVNKFMKKIHNKVLNDRTIRVEIAKNQK
jgi:ATP-dependent RNA helicase DeaD